MAQENTSRSSKNRGSGYTEGNRPMPAQGEDRNESVYRNPVGAQSGMPVEGQQEAVSGLRDAGARSKKNTEDESSGKKAWQMEDAKTDEVSVPAIRHVGPTLESDPKYLELMGSGGPTPEAAIAEQAAIAEPDMSGLVEKQLDPVTGQLREVGGPERLRTRLPGDTSSDPHTDVGSDNATTVQKRGERKPEAA